ncbi:hypothetical protein HRbin15_00999 [bacterium HR15]|nr:hypothetical protein HRbin15_00999 [bacterium HR15]
MYIHYICIILIIAILGELVSFIIIGRMLYKNEIGKEIIIQKRAIFAISTVIGIINLIIILPLLIFIYRYISVNFGEYIATLVSIMIGFILGYIHYLIARFIYRFSKSVR